jgi:hypothetical protein
MKKISGLILFSLYTLVAQAQFTYPDSIPQGAWARREIVDGDTVFVMSLRPARVSASRRFKNITEQTQFYRYRRAAQNVYPYAVQAIALYNEIQEETQNMSKGKRRRHIRREHRELKEDFTEKMKNLSKTEGKVLIKMVEMNLDKPFYDIIRETRGGITATYWHNLGKIWDYNLKEGYQPGNDPILDEILIDYDMSDKAYREPPRT